MSAPDSKGILTPSAVRVFRVLGFALALTGPSFWAGNAYASSRLEASASRLERVEQKLDDIATRLARLEGKLAR